MPITEAFQMPPPNDQKKEWVQPTLMVYGDMTVITQGGCSPPNCKPKVLGAGDDFSTNISTL
jgi:hypothetical protein